MSTEDLTDRRYVPTEPFDSDDPPGFGQLIETVKDSFVSELQKFFDYKAADATTKITETPNIQKFSLGAGSGEDSLRETVKLIMAYGTTPDTFPMIAITSATTRERKMGIGGNFVAHVQYPPSITGTVAGPFDLTDDWTLEIKTWPGGLEDSETTSTITFASGIFASLTSVTAETIARVINKTQALYYQFSATEDGEIMISTGGPCGVTTPNYIEVTGGTAACLLALGFTVGDSDIYTNTANPPKNRYITAGDMSVSIDVVTDDINTRTELSDLVYNFFTFYLEKRKFQLIGRSYQSRNVDPEEWFHIIFQNQFSWSGELNTNRHGGGETYDYIFANRGTVPIFACDYIDRKLVSPYSYLDRDRVVQETTGVVPDGDYTGDNWIKKNNNI